MSSSKPRDLPTDWDNMSEDDKEDWELANNPVFVATMRELIKAIEDAPPDFWDKIEDGQLFLPQS